MTDYPRLIEHAFPLKQASLDSVHEKNVRHGHISTLHIWPARRPLAACRAALIATLLPDPSAQPKPEGTSEEDWKKEIVRRRQELCEKIGGKIVKQAERKKMPGGKVVEREKEATEGGILHWGRETENKATLDWFRQEIRKAYGDRAPKVLDPFAGGGSIPLEAMRLGCEATAVDINPVAWFILKCTLEYPQKLAGKTWPLPDFILENEEFMHAFYKAHPHLVGRTKPTKGQLAAQEDVMPGLRLHREDNDRAPKADLAWQVRAWGRWVLDRARRELAQYYPVYADFEPLDLKNPKPYERLPMQLVPLKDDGNPNIDVLNKEFSEEYLTDKRNPRWVAKPTVAYLWARTVTCKNCRATLPLLKTRWLCKKEKKRILLTMDVIEDPVGQTTEPVKRVVFGIQKDVPNRVGNAAQNREHDKQISAGTMSRAGAKCPCCGTIMTMEDIRFVGKAGRLGEINTTVVAEGQQGKEYRLPTPHEIEMAVKAGEGIQEVFEDVPLGIPEEPTPKAGRGASRAFSVDGYGLNQWSKLFTKRQLITIGSLINVTRKCFPIMRTSNESYSIHEAVFSYLSVGIDRVANSGSTICILASNRETISQTFTRFALPVTWDFVESAPINDSTGGLPGAIEWIARYIEHALAAIPTQDSNSSVRCYSAKSSGTSGTFDLIFTDPPYYDAIPYSDLMDFFYIWLKRSLQGFPIDSHGLFKNELAPKWDHIINDGELIDDAGRHSDNPIKAKKAYEEGMSDSFVAFCQQLLPEGRLVIVFAHKHPDAWETLVTAIIRAGFVVEGSWPIQTEMSGGVRNLGRASLSSSVWLICKKRPETAKPGWDNSVLKEMQENIQTKLREFWDAGIRGPDFVWAATGPALEAYSKHPVVKKANAPGEVMSVAEFLSQVRRIVVDFVVGRVLSGDTDENGNGNDGERLDEVTAYYLLHRHDFGFDEAPAGACILYAISCGLSDKELASAWDLVGFTQGKDAADTETDADADDEDDIEEEKSGSKVKLKTWAQRQKRSLGLEAPGGKPVPLIDRIHCLMHLWRAGDLRKVDEYLDENALRRQELFKRLLQALIELSPRGGDERSLLESLSNHIGIRGAIKEKTSELGLKYGAKNGGSDGEED